MPIELIIQLYLNCELRTANCELFSRGWLKTTRRSSKRYQVRRWHLKSFFENPPQHLKKRIASIDSEAINYLLGRKA
ncbi:MAG: hypothetical protein ACYT04_49080 [Nostoc sp.]|uniref:Uncharacterized protein n=1 Tax=Nostoc punctiforme NIES-2108 TaxID=1356359 RepID=A0A367R956_NOSPU|nr:hypothetical protein A6769_27690 [Nostoc punctiforme NIES-2108]